MIRLTLDTPVDFAFSPRFSFWGFRAWFWLQITFGVPAYAFESGLDLYLSVPYNSESLTRSANREPVCTTTTIIFEITTSNINGSLQECLD